MRSTPCGSSPSPWRCARAVALLALLSGCVATANAPAATSTFHPPADCPSPGPALPATASSEALIEAHGSSLDPYQLTDAVWLHGRPIAVNRAFDFGTAMMMPGIGPGLAAAQRQKANEAQAQALASLTPTVQSSAIVDMARACGVHVFVLLWTSDDTHEVILVSERLEPAPQRESLDPSIVAALCDDLTHQLDALSVESTLDEQPPVAWTCGLLSLDTAAQGPNHVQSTD